MTFWKNDDSSKESFVVVDVSLVCPSARHAPRYTWILRASGVVTCCCPFALFAKASSLQCVSAVFVAVLE